MNKEKLIKLIKNSKLLTALEHDYWLQNVDRLSPEQFGKLEQVLSQAENLQWNEQMEKYMDIVRNGQNKKILTTK